MLNATIDKVNFNDSTDPAISELAAFGYIQHMTRMAARTRKPMTARRLANRVIRALGF